MVDNGSDEDGGFSLFSPDSETYAGFVITQGLRKAVGAGWRQSRRNELLRGPLKADSLAV